MLKKGLFGLKKEDPKKKAELDLKKTTLEKILSIKQSGFKPETFNQTSQLFRTFLTKHFDIGYEFTHPELKTELTKKKIADELRIKILNTSKLITKVNYENKKLTNELFNNLLKDIEDIINLTTITVSITLDLEKIKEDYLKKNLKTVTGEETKEKETSPKKEKKLSKELIEIEHIFKKITDAQNALLSFNLDKAKYIYLEVIYIYKKLSLEEQEKIYPSIKELYETRKRLSYVLKTLT
jgi:hypothetical protein